MNEIPNVSINYTISFDDILKEIGNQLTSDTEKLDDLPDRINFILGYCDNEVLQTEEAILIIAKLQDLVKLFQFLERRFVDYESILTSYIRTRDQVNKFGLSSLASAETANENETENG
jgi:hypothetical protein